MAETPIRERFNAHILDKLSSISGMKASSNEIIYQVYPRSFQDTNGDGIGDLEGIRQRLPYIASLGVTAIWISPFMKSPMKDFGYDVSDYYQVDPLFGRIEDFQRLLEEAHSLHLKVLIDQVWSHTSDLHPWFLQSRSSQNNAKADWYVWANAKADGTPPNNWLSFFGGPAWQWDSRRNQYYLHHFLSSQPTLNLYNEQVKQAIIEVGKFWFDLGADGFRLDAIHTYFYQTELADNPPRLASDFLSSDLPPNQPLSYQKRFNSNCSHLLEGYPHSQANLDWIERLRKMSDLYADRILLGEVGGEDPEAIAALYVQPPSRLHMAYSFGLLTEDSSAATIQSVIEKVESSVGKGSICWSLSNHDVKRVVSRWGKDHPESARLSMALLLSLRGSCCIYQGEELGLTQADIGYEQMQDPFGIEFYPRFKGRDGCRTPMPWDHQKPQAGFTHAAQPWLPIPPEHYPLSVTCQEGDANSVLNAYRAFIHWRQSAEPPVLKEGSITILPDLKEPLLGYERRLGESRLWCFFNLSPGVTVHTLPHNQTLSMVSEISHGTSIDGEQITFQGFGYLFGFSHPR